MRGGSSDASGPIPPFHDERVPVTVALARLVPARARPALRAGVVRYRHLGLRPADAMVVSYPKSGSTWLRFLLAQALSGQEADYASIRERIAPVGRHRAATALLPSGGRLLRTHEPLTPYRGRPGQPVVYLLRDARDVCVSYYNHRRRQGEDCAFEVFAERFLAGSVDGVGSWPAHVRSSRAFEGRGISPLLRLRYEDLRSDPEARLTDVLAFLGVESTGLDLAKVVAANTREQMRAKEDDAFLGRVGMDRPVSLAPERRPWHELVSPALAERFDRACGAERSASGYPSGRSRPSSGDPVA